MLVVQKKKRGVVNEDFLNSKFFISKVLVISILFQPLGENYYVLNVGKIKKNNSSKALAKLPKRYKL